MKKNILFLLLIICLALTLRLFWLNKIPAGISNDEVDYILNAKTIFLTGKDMSQTWSPLSLSTPPFEKPKAELPYLIISPIIGVFNFSLFNAKLPYAIISVLLVAVIYLIINRLFGKTQAIITGLIMAINPWSIYFGRTAYEAPIAVFFFFFAFYILLITKGWKILWAFLPLFIAFFSYIGTKVIFIPFVLIAISYAWYAINRKRFIKQYLLLFLLCVLTLLYFIFSPQSQRVLSRAPSLTSINSPVIADLVNNERHLSLENPFTFYATNKLNTFIKGNVNKYMEVFSANFLFLYGENSAFISLRDQGPFYYFDLLFLILGIVVLFQKDKKLWVFLLGIAAISPLPSIASVDGASYSLRSSLLFPIIALFISLGIWRIVTLRKNKLYIYTISGFLTIVYVILVANFLYNYFFRYPVYGAETFNLSGRIVSKYIELAKEKKDKVIIVEHTDNLASISLFKQYLFYSNSYNKNTVNEVAELVRKKGHSFHHITAAGCPEQLLPNTIVIVASGSCPAIQTKIDKFSIAKLSDGGEIYGIFDTNICNDYALSRYPNGIKINDFEIEKMSERTFCEKFITNLNEKSE